MNTRSCLAAAVAAALGMGLAAAAHADTYYYTAPAPVTTYTYTTTTSVPAGVSVTNRGGSLDDKDMADRIARQIVANGGFDDSSIDVAVYDGDVQLTGTVRTAEQSKRAATIAASFAGHNRVMNDLRVG